MLGGAVIGVSLGRLFAPSLELVVLAGCMGAVISLVLRSSIAALVMPLLGIAATVLTTYTVSSVGLTPDRISTWLLLGCVVSASIAAC